MTKRSAPSSSVEDMTPKKQKLEHATDSPTAPLTPGTTPDAPEAVTTDTPITPAAMEIDSDTTEPEAETPKPQVKGKGKAKAEPKKASKRPPVKQAFTEWTPEIECPPKNPFWGIKPVTGDALPHPDQPSARDSNAATNPPMWENRKFRYKRGSRYVKYFGRIEPEGAHDGPDLDQEDLLILRLIDMRPKGKKDAAPRRLPLAYFYEHGKPNDWNDMQAIKALNDRRGQAITRITCDPPWSYIEREYLAELCSEFPDASIWELTIRHNDRFKDKDYTEDTAFIGSHQLSTGRTVESVRDQYMQYKPAYDRGEAPQGVRFRYDESLAGKALHKAKTMEKAFGKPDKALQKNFDEDTGRNEAGDDSDASDSEEDDAAPAKKTKASKKVALKKSAVTVEASDEDEEDDTEAEVWPPMKDQPKLSPSSEEILTLAGAYSGEHDELVRVDTLDWWNSNSPLSEPPSDFKDEEMTEVLPEPKLADNTGEPKALPSNTLFFRTICEVTDYILTVPDNASPVLPAEVADETDIVIEKMTQEAVSALINPEFQLAKIDMQVQELKEDFQILSDREDADEGPAVPETKEAAVEDKVQAPTTTSQEATPVAHRVSLHATRRMSSLDENYDDDDEELSAFVHLPFAHR